jgi:hypothetical protein
MQGSATRAQRGGHRLAENALEYERQTFTCSACARQFQRTVDAGLSTD